MTPSGAACRISSAGTKKNDRRKKLLLLNPPPSRRLLLITYPGNRQRWYSEQSKPLSRRPSRARHLSRMREGAPSSKNNRARTLLNPLPGPNQNPDWRSPRQRNSQRRMAVRKFQLGSCRTRRGSRDRPDHPRGRFPPKPRQYSVRKHPRKKRSFNLLTRHRLKNRWQRGTITQLKPCSRLFHR